MNSPQLKQFANLWTLTHQPAPDAEWSLEQKFSEAQKQGFPAMGGVVIPEVPELCARLGLEYVCYVDANMETYADRLRAAASMKPARVDVQLADHDTSPAEAAKIWIAMQAPADDLGLQIDLEVHRDTATETPEKTWEIADRFEQATGRKIRLSFDFSHLAVIKHLTPPFAARLLERRELVPLARQMHFRPFNGQHCQVPATDGQGNLSPEFRNYLEFVDALLECWFENAKGDEVLYVCPEMGPVVSSYGLSIFPNVWQDALVVQRETQRLWDRHLDIWRKRSA